MHMHHPPQNFVVNEIFRTDRYTYDYVLLILNSCKYWEEHFILHMHVFKCKRKGIFLRNLSHPLLSTCATHKKCFTDCNGRAANVGQKDSCNQSESYIYQGKNILP